MKTISFIIAILLLQLVVSAQKNYLLTGEDRERLIQQATTLRSQEDFNGAIQLLDSVLMHNKSDAQILLFKGDLQLQAKQYAAATITYKKLLPLHFETTIVTINLSYALFMNRQPNKALHFAKQAWQNNKTNSSAIINYFNAQLWNIKTKDAASFLKEQQHLISPAEQLVLKARLYTTSGNYKLGLQYYDSLLRTFPNKYYIQEYAEVLLGKKEIKPSIIIFESKKNLFSQNEYNAFKQKVNALKMQNVGNEFSYFSDVAKNIRIENSIWWQQNEDRKYRFRLGAGASKITAINNEKSTSQFASVVINERWSKAWSGETNLHLQLIQPSGGRSFTGLTGKQSVQYQPNDRRMIGLFYSAEILNFTASLLQKNIRSNSIGYVTHIMLTGKTGFYSQGSAGALTDKNQRMQLFGSLYHLFRTEPTLKAGINFSTLHFKDSSVKQYFSPNQYLSTEVFADYSTALPRLSKFYLQVQAAAGLQKIEKQNWETSLRFQSELGFRLQHFETALKYQTSNVAATVGTGYKFNWVTLRVMWKW